MQLMVWIGAVFSFEKISHMHADGAVQLALTYMSGAGMHAGSAPVTTTAPGTAAAVAAVLPAGSAVGDTIAVADAMHVTAAHPSSHPSTEPPGQQHSTYVVAPEGSPLEASVPAQQHPTYVEPIVAPAYVNAAHALPQQAEPSRT